MSSEGLPQTGRIILVSSSAASSSTRDAGAEFCLSTKWMAAHGGPAAQVVRTGEWAAVRIGDSEVWEQTPHTLDFPQSLEIFVGFGTQAPEALAVLKITFITSKNTDSCQEGTLDTMLLLGSCNFRVCCNNVTLHFGCDVVSSLKHKQMTRICCNLKKQS